MEYRCYLCNAKLTKTESVLFGIGPTCYESLCKSQALETFHRKLSNPKYENPDFRDEKEFKVYLDLISKNPIDRRKLEDEIKADANAQKELKIYKEIQGLYFKRKGLKAHIDFLMQNFDKKNDPFFKERVDVQPCFRQFGLPIQQPVA